MKPRLLFAPIAGGILLFSSMIAQDSPVKNAVKAVRDQFAPDRRVAVFDVQPEQSAIGLILRGEVDNPEARTAVVQAVGKLGLGTVLDSIRVLPDTALGELTYGIVVLSVGNVRSKPGEAEELSTQVLMGSVVKVLKKPMGGYYYVQMPDKYLGWLDRAAFQLTTRSVVNAWAAARKVIVTGYFGMVREQPEAGALPLCDVVAGCVLRTSGAQGAWTAVELADGRKGYLESSLVEEYDTWKRTRSLTGDNIEKTAKMFLGIPYLWGGTSCKGMDCSGFVKTVYRLNGMELNRDASQQAAMGVDANPGVNFESLQKGDLLFFGQKASAEKAERITHVGIYLEKRQFIHSSGRVRLSSFDPSSPLYEESLLKRFVRARRVIPDAQVPEIRK